MGGKSAIEWTDATWNPVTGCTKITRGCDPCYAERFRGVPGHAFENGFALTLRSERLAQPLAWKRSRMIFVNSMSDLFHKDIPLTFVDRVFETRRPQGNVFQVLTKRTHACGLICSAGTLAAPRRNISGAACPLKITRLPPESGICREHRRRFVFPPFSFWAKPLSDRWNWLLVARIFRELPGTEVILTFAAMPLLPGISRRR